MGKNLKLITTLLRLWIVLSPIMAAIYLVVWIIQIFNTSLFTRLDVLFGFLPKIMDKILFIELDINATDVTMGYVYSATLVMILMFAALKIENRLIDKQMEAERKQKESKARKKLFAQRQKNQDSDICFFGLLEMKFECLNGFSKTIDDLEKLKKEYSKILTQKLTSRFPAIQFIASNKIFIISYDFDVFDILIADIVKYFKVFQDLNNEKCIGSSILLSFECGSPKASAKFMYRLLSKINDLCYLNKVIVLEAFAKKYKYVLTKQYTTVPLGLTKVEIENRQETDIDLYYLENQ